MNNAEFEQLLKRIKNRIRHGKSLQCVDVELTEGQETFLKSIEIRYVKNNDLIIFYPTKRTEQ